MKLHYNDIEQLVEDYLSNKFSVDQIAQFDAELVTNEPLRSELAQQQLLRNLLMEDEIISVRAEVSQSISNITKARKTWKLL